MLAVPHSHAHVCFTGAMDFGVSCIVHCPCFRIHCLQFVVPFSVSLSDIRMMPNLSEVCIVTLSLSFTYA